MFKVGDVVIRIKNAWENKGMFLNKEYVVNKIIFNYGTQWLGLEGYEQYNTSDGCPYEANNFIKKGDSMDLRSRIEA